ncbi:hypothetical protein [Methanimicrococcus stummii]|uniref:hypothetical protein n=1 Tax=Methanimicrococcus stummii TaxID=3028294 RepID=UPI002930AC97|nr:hypothetical protein [Methanimicrococcus sp. Es2]
MFILFYNYICVVYIDSDCIGVLAVLVPSAVLELVAFGASRIWRASYRSHKHLLFRTAVRFANVVRLPTVSVFRCYLTVSVFRCHLTVSVFRRHLYISPSLSLSAGAAVAPPRASRSAFPKIRQKRIPNLKDSKKRTIQDIKKKKKMKMKNEK